MGDRGREPNFPRYQSLFTAMQGLSVGLFDLGLYRFLAGIGTGAEIIVGIPLQCRVGPPRNSNAAIVGRVVLHNR
jgi:hypothetical protein